MKLRAVGVVLLVISGMVLAGCSVSAAPTPTLSPTSNPTPTPTSAPSPTSAHADEEPHDGTEAGHELFIAKGCSACHGQDAEGTGIAPGLAGHSAEMVRRQVRSPVGAMPAFPLATLT